MKLEIFHEPNAMLHWGFELTMPKKLKRYYGR